MLKNIRGDNVVSTLYCDCLMDTKISIYYNVIGVEPICWGCGTIAIDLDLQSAAAAA